MLLQAAQITMRDLEMIHNSQTHSHKPSGCFSNNDNQQHDVSTAKTQSVRGVTGNVAYEVGNSHLLCGVETAEQCCDIQLRDKNGHSSLMASSHRAPLLPLFQQQ